jgi:hypothetical protein
MEPSGFRPEKLFSFLTSTDPVSKNDKRTKAGSMFPEGFFRLAHLNTATLTYATVENGLRAVCTAAAREKDHKTLCEGIRAEKRCEEYQAWLNAAPQG